MNQFQSIQKHLWHLGNDSDFSTIPLKDIFSGIFLTSFEVPFPSLLGACNKQQSEKKQNAIAMLRTPHPLNFSVKQKLERLAMLFKFTLLHLHIPFPPYQRTCQKHRFQKQSKCRVNQIIKTNPNFITVSKPLTNSPEKNFAIFVVSWNSILIFLLGCLLCPASLQRLSHFLGEFSPFRHP